MTSAEIVKIRSVFSCRKKALPLARLLMKAAAEQGATLKDLEAACDAVLEIYRDGLSVRQLEIVQDKCEAAFDRITEGLDAVVE